MSLVTLLQVKGFLALLSSQKSLNFSLSSVMCLLFVPLHPKTPPNNIPPVVLQASESRSLKCPLIDELL